MLTEETPEPPLFILANHSQSFNNDRWILGAIEQDAPATVTLILVLHDDDRSGLRTLTGDWPSLGQLR